MIERRDSRGTRWRISQIPFGGFVVFIRNREGLEQLDPQPVGKAMDEIGVGARSLIMLAGPAANFILAIFLFAVLFLVNGEARQQIAIASIQPDSPAAAAGLQVGDTIVAIEGERVENTRGVLVPIQLGSGREIGMEVLRDGGPVDLTVIPERRVRDNGLGQQQALGTIGVGLETVQLDPKTFNPATALVAGVVETGETVQLSVELLGRIVTGREPIHQLAGPVGIGDVTRRVVTRTIDAEHLTVVQRIMTGALFILQLCALISVGIGLFNLLPLPVLDGGQLVFNAYEAVAGKALPEKIQEASQTAGVFLLIAIAAYVTWGDIIETGVFGSATS